MNKREALLYNICKGAYAWQALYSKSLFDGVKFPIGRCYEDTGCTYKLIYNAKGIIFLDASLYSYRIGRYGSITTSMDSKTILDRKKMSETRFIDLCRWGYRDLASVDALKLLIWYKYSDDIRDKLFKIVKQTKKDVSKEYGFKLKIMFMFLKISRRFFENVCWVYRKKRGITY